ncbi:MAG: hypothetical protein OEW75_10190 [Cyclobacteriaceae bacterium]|nr:hypothetical protein [Cyclobacteriaceae bacterium]
MGYYERNYKEVYDILVRNRGSINSKHIDDIFYAFQIASGQVYFKSRMKAIFDYLENQKFVIIKYQGSDIVLTNDNDLERFCQKYDKAFNSKDL